MSVSSILQNAQSSGAMSLLNSSTNSNLVHSAANMSKAAEQMASHELTKTKGSQKAAATTAVQLKYELAAHAKNRSAETEGDEAYYLTLSEEALEQYHKHDTEPE